jgi:hypothetical protein
LICCYQHVGKYSFWREKTIIIGEDIIKEEKIVNEKNGMVAMATFFSISGDAIFVRFLICCYPHQKLLETIKKPFVAICSWFFVY